MNDTWRERQLGEVIITLKGHAFKSIDYVTSGTPIVRVSDFTANSISNEQLVYLPVEKAINFERYALREHDIVIQTVGSWQSNPASIVGKVICVPQSFDGALLNQNAVKVTPVTQLDKRFLYYRLKNEDFKLHLIGGAQGAANQASITLDTIKKFSFFIPALPTQKKIAGVLSAYDDLIEANLKRIKLLEEMAQITYEEWFVRLRFPNHETTPTNPETSLPEGFSKSNIGALIEFEIGGGWGEDANDDVFSAPSFVIRGTDLDGLNLGTLDGVPYRFHKQSNLASRKLENCDIVFEVSGGSRDEGVAKTGLITSDLLGRFGDSVMCASFCKLLRLSNKKLATLMYHHLKFLRRIGATEIFEIRGASSIINFNWQAFLKFQKIVVPSENLIKEFDEKALQFHKLISNVAHQNALLKEARDLLLPRLMTGLIDIDDYLAHNGSAAVAA